MGEEWLVLFSKIWYNISISQKRGSDNVIGANPEGKDFVSKAGRYGKKMKQTMLAYRDGCNLVSQYIFDHYFPLNYHVLNKALYHNLRLLSVEVVTENRVAR